jgi:hypothetical protein
MGWVSRGLFVVVGLSACEAACEGRVPSPAPVQPAPADALGSSTSAVAIEDAAAPAASGSGALPVASPGSAVTLLVKNLHAPSALAVDKGSVYWIDAIDGDLARVPKRGGVTMTVYAGNGAGFSGTSSVAVDDTDVYFASQVDKLGSLTRQDKNGGKPTVVASSTAAPIEGVALDDRSVYWVLGGGVVKASKSGGAPQALAGGFKGANGVAVDDAHVYWSVGGSDGAIVESGKGGTNTRVLVRGAENAAHVRVDASHVYWQSGARVFKASKVKGEAVQLTEASGNVADIAVDDAYVYFLTPDAVARVPKEGGKGQTYAEGLSTPSSIGVDVTSVYFTTRGTEAGKWHDGTLGRIDK